MRAACQRLRAVEIPVARTLGYSTFDSTALRTIRTVANVVEEMAFAKCASLETAVLFNAEPAEALFFACPALRRARTVTEARAYQFWSLACGVRSEQLPGLVCLLALPPELSILVLGYFHLNEV